MDFEFVSVVEDVPGKEICEKCGFSEECDAYDKEEPCPLTVLWRDD